MKLFTRNCFSYFKNTLKLAYGDVKTKLFSGVTPPEPRFWSGAGRGGEGKFIWRSAHPTLHSKTLDPPLVIKCRKQ